MSESFAGAIGRKVVSRTSAEELGKLSHFVVDIGHLRVSRLVIGKGRKAQLVDWEHVSGFGPDAILLDQEESLQLAVDDGDRAAARGDFELLRNRALSELGNDVGTIDDLTFDPTTGDLLTVVLGSAEHAAAELLAAGSYAVVLSASVEELPAPDA